MAKLKTEQFGDVNIDIEVSSAGRFTAEFNDNEYSGKTLEELQEKLKAAVRKARDAKAVPISVLNMVPRPDDKRRWDSDPFVEGIGVVHGVLRGRHERNNDYLLAEGTTGKGAKFKLSTYGDGKKNITRRLTAEEVTEYTHLAHAVADAEAALEAFRISVHIDPLEALGLKH